jgi:hypothetical protein
LQFQTPGGALGGCDVKSLNGFTGYVEVSVPTSIPGATFAIPAGSKGTLASGNMMGMVFHASFNMSPGLYEGEFTATSNGVTKVAPIRFTVVERPPD